MRRILALTRKREAHNEEHPGNAPGCLRLGEELVPK
jgi:hypothetical protein